MLGTLIEIVLSFPNLPFNRQAKILPKKKTALGHFRMAALARFQRILQRICIKSKKKTQSPFITSPDTGNGIVQFQT